MNAEQRIKVALGDLVIQLQASLAKIEELEATNDELLKELEELKKPDVE